MDLVAVAAVAENGALGVDGELPWPSIPEDREQYRERVAGHPVILGRRTFEAMTDDLAGAQQVVLSRSERTYDVPTAHPVTGVEAAIDVAADLATDRGVETAYVIGGAGVYEALLPHCDRLVLSRVEGTYAGDTFFPEWDREAWTLVAERPHERFTLQEWTRPGVDGPREVTPAASGNAEAGEE